MSKKLPEVTCKTFKKILKRMGFVQSNRTSTSHEKWTATIKGKRRIVTVDCPKAPFTKYLLNNMINQTGFSKKEFIKCLTNKKHIPK